MIFVGFGIFWLLFGGLFDVCLLGFCGVLRVLHCLVVVWSVFVGCLTVLVCFGWCLGWCFGGFALVFGCLFGVV